MPSRAVPDGAVDASVEAVPVAEPAIVADAFAPAPSEIDQTVPHDGELPLADTAETGKKPYH